MLGPKDIEILISGPKPPAVTPKKLAIKVTITLALVLIVGYIGLTSLCNLTNPPPEPWILISDTNKTNPDTASFLNCEWSNTHKAIIPNDQSRPFSFGYLFKGQYSILSIDSTKNAEFDDSAAFWGGIEADGKVWCYFPHEFRETPIPANAKFLRVVHPWIEPKVKPQPSKSDDTITTKDMKRA